MTKSLFKTKNLTELSALILLFGAAAALTLNGNYRNAVIDGVYLWAGAVFPALFPYLVITYLVSSLKITGGISGALSPFTEKVFGVNGHCGYALFISLMSGYPVGAKCVSDLKERGLIGETESVRAAALCSSSSPVFLMGSVGNLLFGYPLFGLLLFIAHLLSVFTVGLTFSFYRRKDRPKKTRGGVFTPRSNLLYDSVYSAVISVLVVGGIITVFYLLTEMLANIGVLKVIADFFGLLTDDGAIAYGAANGIFECTRGLKILAAGKISLFTLPVAAAICGFGGLSVIAQSVAFLNKAKIKTAPFLISKTLAASFNFLFGLILSAAFLA